MTELDSQSLPAWIYRDSRFFDREREAIFRQSWQVMCHQNDIPNPGDYQCLDLLGESLVTIRGADRVVRSFHNVCRHRAARLLDGPTGHCNTRITCPYHQWTYGLDGRLVGMPERSSFPNLTLQDNGLQALEQEIFCGFVFVRMVPGLPAVHEMAAPYLEDFNAYRLETVVPAGRVTLRMRDVNWKNVADNYSDGLHINVAHPGLTRLFGRSYRTEAQTWIDKMWGVLTETPSPSWSETLYKHLLPPAESLSPDRRHRWMYFKLWPNIAFDFYPDQIDFMQFLPVSATQTLIRETAYKHPDASREMNAARYLNWRINRLVSLEDKALIEKVQAGMNSSSYSCGPLGESEVCLRSFARRMRQLIPESRLPHPPTQMNNCPGLT